MIYAAWGSAHRHVHGVRYEQTAALCGEPVEEIVGGTSSPLPFVVVPTAERCAWCHTLLRGASQVAE